MIRNGSESTNLSKSRFPHSDVPNPQLHFSLNRMAVTVSSDATRPVEEQRNRAGDRKCRNRDVCGAGARLFSDA